MALTWLSLESNQMSQPATLELKGIKGRGDTLSYFSLVVNIFPQRGFEMASNLCII